MKVEIFRNRGSIRITGNKFASNSAVNELRTAVEDSWTDSISLAPICHQNENSLSQERSEQVQSLARQLKCVVKLSKSSAKVCLISIGGLALHGDRSVLMFHSAKSMHLTDTLSIVSCGY